MGRSNLLKRLKEESFDVLVIGGGATGAGIVLDAQSRGLKCALVEKGDFASQTSSRSTKLLHGGVRYLEQAFLQGDFASLKLVKEALEERSTLIKIAPHLAKPLPILIPIYRWLDIPKIWGGMKIYDALSGKKNLAPSRFVRKEETLSLFPLLKQKGLLGGVIYTDAMFDDANMAFALIKTAINLGAVCLNYVELKGLNPPTVKEYFSKQEFPVSAKKIINATGPFADHILQMDEPNKAPLIAPSRGSHIVLNVPLTPSKTALLIPKTTDGRVLFCLPWNLQTLVGTTDIACPVTFDPDATEEEKKYLIDHLNHAFNTSLKTSDIQASFAGIRPLLSSEESQSAKRSRDYTILESPSGMITISGGKWTTYRKMAKTVVDKLTSKPCRTDTLLLWGENKFEQIEELKNKGWSAPLAKGSSFTEADALFAIQEEMACTPDDLLQRRLRISLLSERAAEDASGRIVELLKEFGQTTADPFPIDGSMIAKPRVDPLSRDFS